MAGELNALFIEYIHDVMVGEVLLHDEEVHAADPKNIGLLRSAAARPFATFDGIDLHPGIPQKAAALFHSLICNHCFHNGNKRTAVIALDFFLAINDQLLSMSHQEIYELAKETAQANSEGRSPDSILDYLAAKVSRNSVGVDVLSAETLHEGLAPSMSADIKRLVALQRARVPRILSLQKALLSRDAKSE